MTSMPVRLFAFCVAGVLAEPAETSQPPREVLFHVGGQDLFDKTLSFKREGERVSAAKPLGCVFRER